MNLPTQFFCLTLAAILAACGNQVAPTGGPRDTTPPTVTKSDPPTGTLNYAKSEVTFYFNEAVRPIAVGTEILISPLPRKRPKLSLSDNAKRIRIRFDETLIPQTTYVLTLVGVKNHNENLPMTDAFTLAFSTGNFIDSLEISGSVRDFAGDIPHGLSLLLFDADTIKGSDFFGKKPAYLAKLDSAGNFHFRYLRRTQYKLFGVKDSDQSNTYNLPSEPVALPMDTLIVFEDTDTLKTTTLVSFLQDLRGPLVRSYAWVSDSALLIRFSERPRLDWLKTQVSDSLRRDSLPLKHGIWLGGKDLEALYFSPIGKYSSALLQLQNLSDSIGNRSDSLLRLIPSRQKLWKEPILNRPAFVNADTAFELITPRLLPSEDYRHIRIMDTTGKDTVFRPLPIVIRQEGFRLTVRPKILPEPKRRLRIEVDGKLFDGAVADSIYRFVQPWPDISEWATLKGSVTLEDSTYSGPIVVQMISSDKQQTVVGTAYDTVFSFRYLKPGNYSFRVVLDRDSNQTWTPGRVSPYRLPETILFDKGEPLAVRAGWQYEDQKITAGKKAQGKPSTADGSPGTPPALPTPGARPSKGPKE